MGLLEFLGFVVSLITLFVLSYRKRQDDLKRRNNPEEYEREQQDKEERLKKFIRSLEGDMDEDERDHDEEDEDEDDEDEDEEEHVKHVPSPPPPKPQEPAKAAKALLPEITLNPMKKAGGNFNLAEYKTENKIEERHLANPIDKRQLQSKLDWRYQNDKDSPYESPYDKKTYEVIQKREISAVVELLNKLPSKKNMVILHEIFGQPKGLR